MCPGGGGGGWANLNSEVHGKATYPKESFFMPEVYKKGRLFKKWSLKKRKGVDNCHLGV